MYVLRLVGLLPVVVVIEVLAAAADVVVSIVPASRSNQRKKDVGQIKSPVSYPTSSRLVV